jgi:sec-independent protein translocase protein TatB
MFEGRFPELLIIFVVALIVLGPQKLPEVAALIGRWVGNARAMARQFRDQLEEEAQNLKRPAVDPAPAAPPPPAAPASAAPPSASPAAAAPVPTAEVSAAQEGISGERGP